MFNLIKFLTDVLFLKGSTLINIPNLTYTGKEMTLTCGPPPENINIGQISDSEWKFRGRRIKNTARLKITTSKMSSELKVDKVILADAGKSKLRPIIT